MSRSKKNGEIYCIQAVEFELMAKFARSHNQVCTNRLYPSDEDGQSYACYQVIVTDGGVGQNYIVECIECGTKESCTDGINA